jgi:superfamily II DNA or RNA helicase
VITHNPLIPRPGQIEAHDAIISALDTGIRRPLAIEPMAWGKSVLLAMLIVSLLALGRRVPCLAHRKELLEQNLGCAASIQPSMSACALPT